MLNVTEKIRTDPELKELLPALTEWEFEQLEMNILSSPERVAVVVWREREVLLDGHNRYAICRKHKLPYRIDTVSLPDMDAAKLWVINEHLGRRHFSDDQKSYWMGKQLEYQKKNHGGDRKSRYQNDTLIEGKTDQQDTVRSRQEIALQHKVGEATVERNMRYARDVDTIAAAAGGDTRTAILANDIKMTRQEVQKVAKIAEAQPQAAKDVLIQIKASHKRQETKRIVAEAVHRLPVQPKTQPPLKHNQKKKAGRINIREKQIVSRTHEAIRQWAQECTRLGRGLRNEEIARLTKYSDNVVTGSSSLNKFFIRCALVPWATITITPKGRLCVIDRYLMAVCSPRAPSPKADLQAVIIALDELRRMIDRERKEAKASRAASNWNPTIVHVAELVHLLDQIEAELDKISKM